MDQIETKTVVAEARRWIGTPFIHQARVCGSGVDCIGLIVGIAKSLNLTSNHIAPLSQSFIPLNSFDQKDYARDPDGLRLKSVMDRLFQTVEFSEIQPADIILFRLYKQPQHVALVTEIRHGSHDIIHAYQPVGKVVEHHLSQTWLQRIVGIYRIPHLKQEN